MNKLMIALSMLCLLSVSTVRADTNCGVKSDTIAKCSVGTFEAALCVGEYAGRNGQYHIVTNQGDNLPAKRGDERDGLFHYQTTALKNISLKFPQSPVLDSQLKPAYSSGRLVVAGREAEARCIVVNWIWD